MQQTAMAYVVHSYLYTIRTPQFASFELGMLIPRKLHSWVKRRNSRVAIKTLDFA